MECPIVPGSCWFRLESEREMGVVFGSRVFREGKCESVGVCVVQENGKVCHECGLYSGLGAP